MNEDEKLLKAAGLEDYKVKTCKVTYPCDPKEKLIGLDINLRISNHLWIPQKFTTSKFPSIMAIIGVNEDLYSVAFSDILVKTIPVGTELIIAETAHNKK